MQVRLFNPTTGAVGRVASGRTLQQGQVLLYPRGVLVDPSALTKPPTTKEAGEMMSPSRPSLDVNQLVLHASKSIIFTNKPAGIGRTHVSIR